MSHPLASVHQVAETSSLRFASLLPGARAWCLAQGTHSETLSNGMCVFSHACPFLVVIRYDGAVGILLNK